MTTLDQLARRVADLEARFDLLVSGAVGAGNTTSYSPNVLTNGDVEAGLTGWVDWFSTGTAGTLAIETTAPLDGQRSLKMAEAANSETGITWLPGGSTVNPQIGLDVFPTQPGDVWLLTALFQSTVATAHTQLIGGLGTTPTDCYQLQPNGGSTLFVNAVDVPTTANVPNTMQGTLTVPSGGNGYNYIAFVLSPFGVGVTPPVTAWTWWADLLSLQRKTS